MAFIPMAAKAPTRWLAVDEIESISNRDWIDSRQTERMGVLIRLKAVEGTLAAASNIPSGATAATINTIGFYYLDQERMGQADGILHRIRCVHPHPVTTPAQSASERRFTGEQQDRAETRRWQTLRFLETLLPEDLL